MAKTLRLILGDQLNQKHHWYKTKNDQVLYIMMEMRQETDYVRHHIQKVIAFFMAMRSFSQWLKEEGHEVIYLTLDNHENEQNLTKNLRKFVIENNVDLFEYQLPDEFRLDMQLKNFCQELTIRSKVYDTEHFLTSRTFLADFFKGKKNFLMESFYREMRKKFQILMEGDEPIAGKWNFDQENRNKLKDPSLLKPSKDFPKNVSEIKRLLEKEEVATIGKIMEGELTWPTTREQSLELLEYFCHQLLPNFGVYQDAMYSGDAFLFHSKLSFSLNIKMLSPLEVVTKVEQYWYENQNNIPISQVEGFIRQIIGWREYMRGVYWAKMPGFASLNFFEHNGKLPEFFWSGKTKMNCLKHAINQSLDYAYAHHIQRLMITGNFALLAGVHPDEVDLWYLGIYIDAVEWVEITNTRGMSQYADGGIVGTKPYVSSANYIDKMSDYCGGCYYDKSKKVGEKSCPFNSLYWHFYDRNEKKLAKNPRIGMVYRTWSKMKEKEEILRQAKYYLAHLDEL